MSQVTEERQGGSVKTLPNPHRCKRQHLVMHMQVVLTLGYNHISHMTLELFSEFISTTSISQCSLPTNKERPKEVKVKEDRGREKKSTTQVPTGSPKSSCVLSYKEKGHTFC